MIRSPSVKALAGAATVASHVEVEARPPSLSWTHWHERVGRPYVVMEPGPDGRLYVRPRDVYTRRPGSRQSCRDAGAKRAIAAVLVANAVTQARNRSATREAGVSREYRLRVPPVAVPER
jgi:hypothetical protein